jgi:hypothetical protein
MKENKICQNCSKFIQNINDLNTGQGICVEDASFESFLDEILEDANFSRCYEIYKQKRFNGEKEACNHYEEPEAIEYQEVEDLDAYLIVQGLKGQNVDEINMYLQSDEYEKVEKAISLASMYISLGNQSAYEYLLNYYLKLEPAISLKDVHLRIKIIDAFYSKELEQRTIEAYVYELSRTESNNTTRKLYSLILERLDRCSKEITRIPLLQLLEKNQHSYKIKKRIMEIISV